MTLIIPLKPGADINKLTGILVAQQDAIDAARREIATLHYARFVLFDHSTPNLQPQANSTGPFSLAVITDYDGDFDVYVQDFVNHLGPAFTLLLSFSATGQDLLPLNEHVQGFIDLDPRERRVAARAQRRAAVLRRLPRHRAAGPRQQRRLTLDLADIQGTVLRGYRVDFARHHVLRVLDAPGARRWLGSLVDGSPSAPQVTTAERWRRKPKSFLNLGITASGRRPWGSPSTAFRRRSCGARPIP